MVRVEVQTRKGKSLGFYDVSTVDELGEQFEVRRRVVGNAFDPFAAAAPRNCFCG